MAQPRKKHTLGRTKRRRAGQKKITTPTVIACPKCKHPVRPHRMCNNCGYYNGKQIVDVLNKLERKEAKKKGKEIASTKAKKPLDAKELSKK